ncbi:MAG TPA: tRNA pseudouridine(38-40) synthase TruA [Dongiaceae bacterium]|jgi:tRNA pseudouridine38-40 synthase|nr:tRNA pseudouridine(38-40) synthase TruA [Dongiaceae bacterium]
MRRYRLTIEYAGTALAGWQRQANAPSVQAHLENALFAMTGERREIVGAGRTDAGVHALGQVAHVDLEKTLAPGKLCDGLNFYVRAHGISVLAARYASKDFHARFSARARHYLYRIVARRAPLALAHERAWWVRQPLDVAAMREAARFLVGRHDFTSFRASLCQASSPDRTLDRLDVTAEGEEIHIHAQARSFLHHQVRNMTGSLALVGRGKWRPDDMASVLAARDRTRAGPTAPPHGLYLTAVLYGEEERDPRASDPQTSPPGDKAQARQ